MIGWSISLTDLCVFGRCSHPLNEICGAAGIVVERGTLHSSGKGGIGPSGGVLDSNLLYILRYLAGLPEAAAAAQLSRLATVESNIDGAIGNTNASALDPTLWAAMEAVLAAPVRLQSLVRFNLPRFSLILGAMSRFSTSLMLGANIRRNGWAGLQRAVCQLQPDL